MDPSCGANESWNVDDLPILRLAAIYTSDPELEEQLEENT